MYKSDFLVGLLKQADAGSQHLFELLKRLVADAGYPSQTNSPLAQSINQIRNNTDLRPLYNAAIADNEDDFDTNYIQSKHYPIIQHLLKNIPVNYFLESPTYNPNGYTAPSSFPPNYNFPVDPNLARTPAGYQSQVALPNGTQRMVPTTNVPMSTIEEGLFGTGFSSLSPKDKGQVYRNNPNQHPLGFRPNIQSRFTERSIPNYDLNGTEREHVMKLQDNGAYDRTLSNNPVGYNSAFDRTTPAFNVKNPQGAVIGKQIHINPKYVPKGHSGIASSEFNPTGEYTSTLNADGSGITSVKQKAASLLEKVARSLGSIPQSAGPEQMDYALRTLAQLKALVKPTKNQLEGHNLNEDKFQNSLKYILSNSQGKDRYSLSDMAPNKSLHGGLGAVIGGLIGGFTGSKAGDTSDTLMGALGGAGIGGIGAYLHAGNKRKNILNTAKMLKAYGLLNPELLSKAYTLLASDYKIK